MSSYALFRDLLWHELEVEPLECQTGPEPPMCHVLIIEDEELIALLIRDVLQDEGATSFSFAATQDGAVAAAEAQLPAFITSDVKLIDGTGPLAVQAIQSKWGPIPVVYITGSPAECEPNSSLTRIVTKPFSRDLVASALRELGIHR